MIDKKYEVICVDDEMSILDIYSDILKELDVKFTCFKDFSSATKYVFENKSKIATIFSDYSTPDANAFEFKKNISAFADDIPFIVITGFWTKEMVQEGLEFSISRFIEKPFNKDDIHFCIEKFAQ